jgi:hypothetical protein
VIPVDQADRLFADASKSVDELTSALAKAKALKEHARSLRMGMVLDQEIRKRIQAQSRDLVNQVRRASVPVEHVRDEANKL